MNTKSYADVMHELENLVRRFFRTRFHYFPSLNLFINFHQPLLVLRFCYFPEVFDLNF